MFSLDKALVPKSLPTTSLWKPQQHGNHTAATWLRVRWEVNIKMDIREVGFGGGTGFIWLRIETGGGHL
jgi:hypothetical protein